MFTAARPVARLVVAALFTLPVFGPRGVLAADAGAYARDLAAVPTAERLRAYHDLLAAEPHDAGTPGDAKVVDAIADLFGSFGLEVTKQELTLYLPTPVSGVVEIAGAGENGGALALPTREVAVEGDDAPANEALRGGWNAWSGSGDVTAEVVYANYGTREDFARLAEWGVDVRGKVVLARYGKVFRGFKARFAEQAGAAAVVLFTDPADDGWGKGLPYPEGGWANGSSIQRGSLGTLDYPGDPTTPFESSADPNVRRLNPDRVGLPTIPVQPIGWDAAEQILSRMTGRSVPDNAWQGGLPLRYRLTGGPELRVRVAVEQTRGLIKTWNVLGRLPGRERPDETVIVGCHHDAWGHGAGDPLAGMIAVLETARAFGELSARGQTPRRSVVFAAWGAEENGIAGSTEYVEAMAAELTRGAIAYLNLDMAAMGPEFGASASPSLHRVIAEAAGMVPQARDPSRTVLDAWRGRGTDADDPSLPSFGALGGGSDHVGFLCHVCVPSAALGAGGADGVSYHTAFDTLAWYRKVVGEDYEPALMISRVTAAAAGLLAEHAVAPLDPARYATAASRELAAWKTPAGMEPAAVEAALRPLRESLEGAIASPARPTWARFAAAGADAELASRLTADLLSLERDWCLGGFDTGRRWYRSGWASPDPSAGYAPWVLPGLRSAMDAGDTGRLDAQARAAARWFDGLRARVTGIDAALTAFETPEPADSGADAPEPDASRFKLERIDTPPQRP